MTDAIATIPIPIQTETIAAFCRRWHISELALFGSVLRHDFHAGSDIDVLVTFEPNARQTLTDHAQMEAELSTVFGRNAEVVYRRVIERDPNYLLRQSILESARVIYVG